MIIYSLWMKKVEVFFVSCTVLSSQKAFPGKKYEIYDNQQRNC